MIQPQFEDLIHALLALIALFIISFGMDYPSWRKKERKKRCDRGNHNFTQWRFDYEIGYNSKDVFKRHCKHCQYTQTTISRLHPSYCSKLKIYDGKK